MRRWIRLLGTFMVLGGTALLLWALVVWQWEDPFTSLYNHFKQRELAAAYQERLADFRPRLGPGVSLAAARREVAREARSYRRAARRGEAIGRITIPRLGLEEIVVNGTDADSLRAGPGRDPRTFMPGQGELIYIAGHRTTYGAPFSRIDALRPGDRVTVEVPYATFEYRISRHVIVQADDISRLESHGREVLALQACHPRFFASHRYITYAKPVRMVPRGGPPVALAGGNPATAAG